MSEMIVASCNMNQRARVRLTRWGRARIQKNAQRLGVPPIERVETDGWTEWQLWELMSEFGMDCFMGGNELPFEGNEVRMVFAKATFWDALRTG